AERILLDASYEHPSATVSHALGRFYLAERKFELAIKEFETALKSRPNDAQLLSDLAAAQIEKSKTDRQSPEPGQASLELARALQNLGEALQLDGALQEALFNRALCLQQMNLREMARQAWEQYLRRDGSSAWAQ